MMDEKLLLNKLRSFVKLEHEANKSKLYEVWRKPLASKLQSGETQAISKAKIEDKNYLLLTLGEGDSRFREGDMICLHLGDPFDSIFVRQATIEAENEREWLIRTFNQDYSFLYLERGNIYADPDNMDLKPFYDKALDDIAHSPNGISIVLPLLAGKLDSSSIFLDNYDDAANYAEKQGLNDSQIDAVGKGVAAKYLACIQGPPGTGKTKVISHIVKQLVEEKQRVFITSHTHMAINNALNKIAKEIKPVIKVGNSSCIKGLDRDIKYFERGDDWRDRPDSGYVIGATPFATCSMRLENFEFDTVIFDEASQITVPLAVMAMRKAKRYVFVGDHKQLPPVILSKSVLNHDGYSVFTKLITGNTETSTMLNQTYRMNSELSLWPSKNYYEGKLIPARANAKRNFTLPNQPLKYLNILSDKHSFVFIKSPGINSKTSNTSEAKLVVDIILAATDAGMELQETGVVSPYRNQGKNIRKAMALQFGFFEAKKTVVDTVERMQGQEREMIIISLCTTDPQFLVSVASFFFQSERLNVAITRPKTKLILIGPKIDNDMFVRGIDKELIKKIDDYKSLVKSAYQYKLEEG